MKNAQTLKARIKRVSLGLGLAAMLAVSAAVPAFADAVTGTTAITGGTLAMAATDAPALTATLNGTDQTVTDTFVVDAKDNTGTGAGWKLQITSTQFSTGGATPKTLSTTAASITAASSVCDAGTCTLPTNGISYPLTVPAAATAPAAVSFYNAALNTGMGDFTVTPTIAVAVPANTYAGNYSSTVTITIASAP